MALTAAHKCIPSPRCRAGPGLPALPTVGPFWHPALGAVGQGMAMPPTPLLPQPAGHLGDPSPASVIWGVASWELWGVQGEGHSTAWGLDCLSLVEHHLGVGPVLMSPVLPSARRAVPHWQHAGRRAGPKVPPLPTTPNPTAPLSHPAEDAREKGSRKAAELGECSRGPKGDPRLLAGLLRAPRGLTGCSRCHRFGGGPGQPLLPAGPCPTPGVPSARPPLPALPGAAPPGRAARPVCPAVLQGAGAQQGGLGAVGSPVPPAPR